MAQDVPENIHTGYTVEYVWKPTSFDRMQKALRTFAIDETCISGYLYHCILGKEAVKPKIKLRYPDAEAKLDKVPGLPPLNWS